MYVTNRYIGSVLLLLFFGAMTNSCENHGNVNLQENKEINTKATMLKHSKKAHVSDSGDMVENSQNKNNVRKPQSPQKGPLPLPPFCTSDRNHIVGIKETPMIKSLSKKSELLRHIYCEGNILEFEAGIENITTGDVLERFPSDSQHDKQEAVILKILSPLKYSNRKLWINFLNRDKLLSNSPWKTKEKVTFKLPEKLIGNKVILNKEVYFMVVYEEDLVELHFL